MKYELIDQTGEQYGRNRQWVVATLGAKKRAFCVVPAWEDYPAEQVKADAEQVLNALNERDALRAKLAALVEAGKGALNILTDEATEQFIEDAWFRPNVAHQQIKSLKAALAAAESEAAND